MKRKNKLTKSDLFAMIRELTAKLDAIKNKASRAIYDPLSAFGPMSGGLVCQNTIMGKSAARGAGQNTLDR